jgi:hypothetical protein
VDTKFGGRAGRKSHNAFPPSPRNTGTPRRSISYVRRYFSPACALTASYIHLKENIPLSFRSVVGISKLLRGLLPTPDDHRSIQSIYFPPHHQDPPDTQSKCKGFALLTLSEPSVISHLLTHFPYHYHEPAAKSSAAASADDDCSDEASPEVLEARKAGFRTLPKERWEALQAEYVEYRDALLRSIAMSSSSAAPPATAFKCPPPPDNAPESQPRRPTTRAAPPPPPSSSRYTYPPGCVIFARHVPPDTNKTALRAQFSALIADGDNDNAAALDYVDYTKGLDSVRLYFIYAHMLLPTLLAHIGGGINSVICAWRRESTRCCCYNDSNDVWGRRERRSRLSCWTDGERRCIGSACPTRCARTQCSARRRSRFEEMPCGLMTTKIHQESLVCESGGDGGDEWPIGLSKLPVSHPVGKKASLFMLKRSPSTRDLPNAVCHGVTLI